MSWLVLSFHESASCRARAAQRMGCQLPRDNCPVCVWRGILTTQVPSRRMQRRAVAEEDLAGFEDEKRHGRDGEEH